MSEPELCVGNVTKGILDNALDLVDVWQKKPYRRDEFGETELYEIEQAARHLAGLQQFILIHRNRKKLKGITNAVAS